MDATKTLKNSWKEPLSNALRKSHRLALIGVGQELRGDDAAGVLLIRRLMDSVRVAASPPGTPAIHEEPLSSAPLLFEAGSLPEASAGPLRRYQPEWVVFMDSAEMGEPPGTIRWLEPSEAEGFAGSTHTFPIGGLCKYLASELGCRAGILGIQPKNLEFDSPVSEEVLQAIEEIAEFLHHQITEIPEE
jgi:hydrogenase 3 maturation protease